MGQHHERPEPHETPDTGEVFDVELDALARKIVWYRDELAACRSHTEALRLKEAMEGETDPIWRILRLEWTETATRLRFSGAPQGRLF